MFDDIFLLDTNVVSNSSKERPDPQISQWLRTQSRIAIPFAVFIEIGIGISKNFANDNPSKALALSDWLDELLRTEFVYAVPTPAVARKLADMYFVSHLSHLWYTDPDNPKKRKPGQDLFVAATAIVYDYPIATCDEKDYRAIAEHFTLPGVFNPSSGTWLVPRTKVTAEGTVWPTMVA